MFKIGIMIFLFICSFSFALSSNCPEFKIPEKANEDKKMETFLKLSWDDYMIDRPEWAYDIGYKELGSIWSNDSLKAIVNKKNKAQCYKNVLSKIKRSKLSAQNKINFDIFSQQNDLTIDLSVFPGHFLVLNQLSGVHMDVVDTLLNMPQNNKVEVTNLLKRLELIPQKISQHQILLQESLNAGISAPQVVLKDVLSQFDDILKENPKDSLLYKPFIDLKALDENSRTPIQESALKTIREKVYPAMQDFKNFLATTYIPQARKSISIADLPNGKKWYEALIRHHTTTTLTADEIHQLGLKEVQRILQEMEQVKEKAGFKKDLKAFNQYLLQDPQFFYKQPEQMMRDYRDIAKRADAVLPAFFKTLPRLSYGVREIPLFKSKSAPAAYYMPGSLSAGRAGFFEVNVYDLKARPKWAMEALTLHESVPGHHLQIALAQEMGELPDFRKNDGFTAFAEGWGLYAESLGKEMGFYQDAYSRYGQLSFEMWRAVRLVVDTGLHSKGWSRDQALKYFKDHVAKTDLETMVEVDRYIVWPGQALAYKVGELKIQELKRKSQSQFQDKFNIREFHEEVLAGGAMPLTLLESKIDAWIAKSPKLQKKNINK